MREIDKQNKSFEDIKHVDENNFEFWYARELQIVLNYKEWRKIENILLYLLLISVSCLLIFQCTINTSIIYHFFM